MCSRVHEECHVCVNAQGMLCSLLNYVSELGKGGVFACVCQSVRVHLCLCAWMSVSRQ